MSKEFDYCRGSMICPVCGGWVSYEEYIHNKGICDDCWEKEYSEFELYERAMMDEYDQER